MRRLTKEEFIEKAKKVHGDKYDYSLVEYLGARNAISIICNKHGLFLQRSCDHLNGSGCLKCSLNSKRLTKEEFIEKAKKVHGDKYDYSLVEYENENINVKIICTIHGVFEQSPHSHIVSKSGCKRCKAYTKEEFIEKAKKVHGDKYDYSLVEYEKSNLKVKIICPIHGVFEQRPAFHIGKSGGLSNGCPRCNSSHGENNIRSLLLKNNILFEEQKKFKDCRNSLPLSFDFYLPEKNICIEFQGRQHFEPFSFGEKSLEKFNKQIKNDNIKRDYCSKEGIELIEIKYDDVENIESIILAKLIV